MEIKERLKKKGGHFRLVGGKFNNQGNMRLILGGFKANVSSLSPR